ncbi:hypothetical protein [Endozoicomonas sp.]|uniref:hypothetical protein n=1 Tax=Endozoicomonas sp. TaxID=1892382 RepID=UPI002883B152|nr:hypothetical protein [Endozoicomonas sp.]
MDYFNSLYTAPAAVTSTNQFTKNESKSESKSDNHLNRKNFSKHSVQDLDDDETSCRGLIIKLGKHIHQCPEDKWKGICEFMVDTINGVTGEIAKLDLKTPFTFTPEIKQHWNQQFSAIRNDPKIKNYENSVGRKKKSKEPSNILKCLKDEYKLPEKVHDRIYELYSKRKENNKLIRLINAVEQSHLISPKAFINAVHKSGHQGLVEDLKKSSFPIYPVNDETDRQDLCCHRRSFRGDSDQSVSSFASSEQSPLTDDSENPQDFPSSSWPRHATPKNHQLLKHSVTFAPDTHSNVLTKKIQDWNAQKNNPPEQQQREPLPEAQSDKSKGLVSSANPKTVTNQKITQELSLNNFWNSISKPLTTQLIDSLPENSERNNTAQIDTVIKPQKNLQKPAENDSILRDTSPSFTSFLLPAPDGLPLQALAQPEHYHSQFAFPEETEPDLDPDNIMSQLAELQRILDS